MELPIIQKLKKEIEVLQYELKVKLPKEIEAARAHGDLRENAEYEAAKERQGFVSARISQLAQRMRELSLYTVDSIPQDSVAYGSLVTVTNLDDGENHVFDIVFPEEVDASAGMISLSSPLGRALLNKKVGDEVMVTTPKSTTTYEILEFQTLHDRNAAAGKS